MAPESFYPVLLAEDVEATSRCRTSSASTSGFGRPGWRSSSSPMTYPLGSATSSFKPRWPYVGVIQAVPSYPEFARRFVP